MLPQLPEILYRDHDLLILNKQAGMMVHPGPRGQPSLEDSLAEYAFELPRPPALAHRIDRDTSGCLLLGRHRKALQQLGKLFSQHKITKSYWAVVAASPTDDAGMIDLPLFKDKQPKGWRMIIDPRGQPAITKWRVLGRGKGCAWLELQPATGRTHQLRVHCQAMGWPIMADSLYGQAPPDSHELHLLARRLNFLWPAKDAPRLIDVTAPPPAHMLAALQQCGYHPEECNAV